MKWACRVGLILIVLLFIFGNQKLISKNKYTVKITQPDPIKPPQIGSVSVTPENKIQVSWSEVTNENIIGFNLYRNSPGNNESWNFAGHVNYPGNFSFIDPTSFPNIRPYQYRISAVDLCGNEIYCNEIHESIELNVSEEDTNQLTLNWTTYQGFKTTNYKIYRGDNPENLMLLDSLTSSNTTYHDYFYPNISYYQVEAIEKVDTSNVEQINHTPRKARSNIVSRQSTISRSDSLNGLKIQLYPNPLTTSAVVVFPYDSSQTYQLSILDLSGHIVYTKRVFSGEVEIERGNLKEGLYILQIAGKKILRKKLMVWSYKI